MSGAGVIRPFDISNKAPMRREHVKAAAVGALATAALAALIVLGSRNLAHFDAALVAYTFAVPLRDLRDHLSLRDVAPAPADGVVLAARLAGSSSGPDSSAAMSSNSAGDWSGPSP